jgi:DNA sulfur modification protein DndC
MNNLWGIERMTLEESIERTIDDIQSYGPRYKHWAIAYSGGKDSSATVTLIAYLLATGQITPPETLTVLYADTRMELPPLHACAMNLLKELEARGMKTQIVLPALDDRFFVYMFGRGVPAPKNLFRWCTSQIKIEPMESALLQLREQYGEKFLMFTGVREGESAVRDQRIKLSCSKDGAECGQGWFQESTPESVADTLAPLLHWRVCHVWDWLMGLTRYDHGFSTAQIAEAYGGDEAEEINARTGCVGCNLASKDVALDAVIKLPQWAYLAPLKRLRPLYQEMKSPIYRIRKVGERKKDGTLSKSNMRMGPYHMDARRYGLSQVLSIQDEVNGAAREQNRPLIDLINEEEYARILELIEANTWPDRWTGEEIHADVLVDQVVAEGIMQPLLSMEVS